MKQQLTLTLERELIPTLKRYAREHDLSLSELVERQMKKLIPTPSRGRKRFSEQLRGVLRGKNLEDLERSRRALLLAKHQ